MKLSLQLWYSMKKYLPYFYQLLLPIVENQQLDDPELIGFIDFYKIRIYCCESNLQLWHSMKKYLQNFYQLLLLIVENQPYDGPKRIGFIDYHKLDLFRSKLIITIFPLIVALSWPCIVTTPCIIFSILLSNETIEIEKNEFK